VKLETMQAELAAAVVAAVAAAMEAAKQVRVTHPSNTH
jgi:hypothetical protein